MSQTREVTHTVSKGTLINGVLAEPEQEEQGSDKDVPASGWGMAITIVLLVATVGMIGYTAIRVAYVYGYNDGVNTICDVQEVPPPELPPPPSTPRVNPAPPQQLQPKASSQDPVQQGNAPVGGGQNVQLQPVGPPVPEPGAPSPKDPSRGVVRAPGFGSC
jgi:hypothetical protein